MREVVLRIDDSVVKKSVELTAEVEDKRML